MQQATPHPHQGPCSTSYSVQSSWRACRHTASRWSVRCGSASSHSVRFRLEYTPPNPNDEGPGVYGRAESIGHELEADSDPRQLHLARRPGQIRVRNWHAQLATLTPFRMPHQGPLSNEEYFVVDLERDYNRDLPKLERAPDGKLIFRPGFLQLLQDPDVPFSFVYSGVERFVYTWPERSLQALATAVCVAVSVAATAALASWQPELAAALVISWLRKSLSIMRCAVLTVLVACDQMWLYWALLAGKIIDGVLERHAPPLRDLMWWLFKMWMAWCLLTTAMTPVLPIGPLSPWAGGPFTYPFRI